jgi:hypothetical protein
MDPTSGHRNGLAWEHRIVTVDARCRACVGIPGIRYSAVLAGTVWRLTTDPDGPHLLDPRGRLGVPIGIRSLLGVVDGGPLGCSSTGDVLVLWSVGRLDAVVDAWVGEGR